MVNDASLKEPLPPASPESMSGDGVDPELMALPAPPEGRRIGTMAVMALAVVVALGLTSALRHDVAYFFTAFSGGAARPLGEATQVVPATLTSNSFVELEGTPMASQVVRYRRLLSGETFAVFPLAGQRTIFVHMPEGGLDMPRASYSGRLVTFGDMGGRLDGVRSFFAGSMGTPVTNESYVLLVDEPPQSAWWALALSALCVLFVLVDVWLLVRWFRPLPSDDRATSSQPDASA